MFTIKIKVQLQDKGTVTHTDSQSLLQLGNLSVYVLLRTMSPSWNFVVDSLSDNVGGLNTALRARATCQSYHQLNTISTKRKIQILAIPSFSE